MGSYEKYFSIVAFLIMMRETLEAAVIISIMLQVLNRSLPRLKRQVWIGAFTGLGVALIFAVVFVAAYYAASTLLFSGNAKLIFTGCIAYLAAIMITVLAFAMIRFSNYEKKWQRRLENTTNEAAATAERDQMSGSKKARYGVFILAFTTVLREGIEAVIFLAGVGSTVAYTSIPISGVAGIIVGLAIGFAIFYSGRTLKDLKVFFIVTTTLLFFIAAGQVSIATASFQIAGVYGHFAVWQSERDWWHSPVWDASKCCYEFDPKNPVFPIFRAIFGWQSKPTPIQLLFYFGYWAIVLLGIFVKWRKGTLTDADYKYNLKHKKLPTSSEEGDRDGASAASRDALADPDPLDMETGGNKDVAAVGPSRDQNGVEMSHKAEWLDRH